MYRYAFVVLALFVGTTAFAQQRVQTPAEAEAHRIDASAVHQIVLDDAQQARSIADVLRGGGGPILDSLVFWDSTGLLFGVELTEDTSSFYYRTLEFSQRHTPGEGNGTIFAPPSSPPLPAAPGQVTELGFWLSGSPTGTKGDTTDALAFLFTKTERADSFIVRPTADDCFISIPIPFLGPGFLNTVDVTSCNLFFEADEEFFWTAFLLSDDAGIDPQVRFLLDDGLVTPKLLGNYSPPRSILFAEPPFVGAPGFYTWSGSSNYWWHSVVDYSLEGLNLDTEINAACGTIDNCNFQAGQRLTYTACATNVSGTSKVTRFEIYAILPDGSRFNLENLTVPVPPGGPFCQSFSEVIPSVAPDGFYEIRIDAIKPGDPDVQDDYDHFFFTKSTPTGERVAALYREGRTHEAEVRAAPSGWGHEAHGEWSFEASARTAEPRAEVIGAYPNPFNPQTTLRFAVSQSMDVRLAVYDVLGREVAVLVNGRVETGTHEATFDARDLASGLYLFRLEAGQELLQTGRLTLLK